MERPDLDKLRALCDGATLGKWEVKKYDRYVTGYIVKTKFGHKFAQIDEVTNRAMLLSKENADFIAESRQAVPKMIAYIKHLEYLLNINQPITTFAGSQL